MSESTAALEGNVSPPTVSNNSEVGSKNNKTAANEITTETTMTINDPPVIETSQRMPPLVVKQFGLLKPGVPPTAGSVSFDYTGPPVKVTNATVLDLVNQFGIQNAWLAVLKLRGYSVSKEEGETLLPIKRFRERVRKLKSTAETLKSRSDDSTTFLSKEFTSTATMGPNDAPATKNGSKGYSTTDAVIESILRQAVNETDGAGSSGPSTAAASNEAAKPKRGRKKGKTEAPATAYPANPPRASSATIDDVVSSIVNKIRNNEPFDTDLNIDLPTSPPLHQPQQPQVLYAPQMPGQTYVMLQDDQMIPIMQQQIQQSAPISPAKTTRSRKRGKTAQQQQQQPVPTQYVQYSNFVPQPQTAATVRTTTSNTNVPQHVTVVTVPRGQPTTTNYVVPSGYANNNQAVIYSNINDYMRNSGISNSTGQITKLVTYQPGVQYTQPFVTNPSPQGMSPNGVYQPGPAHPQGQYMVHPVTPAAPPPQVVQSKPTPPVPQTEVNDDRKKTTRRKTKTNKNDMFMENFNESDFEEFATPKRKESIKKTVKKKDAKPVDEKKATKTTVAAEKAPKKTIKETEKNKKKPTTRKRKHSTEPESEEDEGNESDDPSPIIDKKGKQTGEVVQLKRQLQAERSRHYTQKRRATKLDDDYKRVLDRLQQTELNLALQMSECERLQGEMKTLRTENEELIAQLNGQDIPKPILPAVRTGRRSAVAKKPVIKRKVASPSPAPVPTPPSKKSSAATNKGIASKAPVNNKKRGRHTVPSPDADEPSPPTSADGNKPAFTPDDFIPRRAAASKRIRYF